jgi:hypothetical protein
VTSPLAVVTLTYDGEDIQDFAAGILVEILTGIGSPPVVRGEDTTIPAAAGSLEGNRINDYLPIELLARIFAAASATSLADQQASHYANLLVVRTLFKTNRARAPLVATLPGGTVLTIQAHPLNIIPAEIVAGEYTELSISLSGDDDWVVS